LGAGLGGGAVEHPPGAAHAGGLGADVDLLAGGDGGIELGLLGVELRPQRIVHEQPQATDAPLLLHLPSGLIEAVEDRLGDELGRRHRIAA
jgi:hypothetical protein